MFVLHRLHPRVVAVGERTHHSRPPQDLPDGPFERIIGAQVAPVLPQEAHVAQGLLHSAFNGFGRLAQYHPPKLRHNGKGLASRRFQVFLGVDGFEHLRHFLDLPAGHLCPHVAILNAPRETIDVIHQVACSNHLRWRRGELNPCEALLTPLLDALHQSKMILRIIEFGSFGRSLSQIVTRF